MNQFYLLTIFLLLLFPVSSIATMNGKWEAVFNGYPIEASLPAPGDLTATITGDAFFCIGSANATIAFEGLGGSAPYTFTYRVNGGVDQTISTSSLSSIVNLPVSTSVAGEYTYRITSIKGATGKATLVDISRVITVRTAPVADFSFATSTACSGTLVSFTSSVQGSGTYRYDWDFGDGQTSLEQNPSHAFISKGCATASFTVSLTVTDENGCSATRSHSVSVLQMPDISFSDLNLSFGEPFSNCGSASISSPSYTVKVGNTSLSASCITSYTIDWGDGSAPVAGASFPTSHTYATLGAFEMVITAYGANGCSNAITYVVRNMNNPSVGITSPGTTTNLCAPTPSLGFEIAKWGTNALSTTYRVDYGDGSPVLTLTQEQLEASPYYNEANPSASLNYPIPHSYLLSNCPNDLYTVHLTATNACSSTEATVNNITVFNKTTPDFTVAAHACVNSSVVLTNTSTPGYNASCSQTSIYTWDFGDGTAQEVTAPTLPKNTQHTYAAPGQYTIKLTSKNICGESTTTRVITIDPPLTAIVTGTGMISGTINVCQDAPRPVITFTGTNGTAPYTFTYRINNGPIQTITTPAGSSSVTITVPTGVTGSFTYTLVSISDASPTSCTQPQTGTVTVVVSAPPTGSISGNVSACINDASPQITFTGSGGTKPYTFTYTINGGPVHTISTVNSSSSVTVNVPATTAGTFIYQLVGMQDAGAAACSGTVSATAAARATIYPRPDIMTLPGYAYCNGEVTSVINFSNTVAGTTYRWTNSNPSIGLAASGNGSIPSFTAKNTTNVPVSATITVIPSSNGCDGSSQTFLITVSPSAVLFSQGAQTICSGDQTSEVTLSSPQGASISWTAAIPAGITGAVSSGTNTIPVQTLVNTTSTPLAVTYTATAALPVDDPCAGTQYAYTITVNPRPVIQQAFTAEICSGNAFTVLPEGNAENSIPSGTKYTWSAPVVSPSGSLTGGGAQATPQASISQTLVNNTAAVATATYTVTPIANGCAGDPFTLVVTVLPEPKVNPVNYLTFCQGEQVEAIAFTGPVSGAVYRWTSNNTFTGIAGNGTDQVGTFTAVNTGSAPIQSIITVTPVFTDGTTICEGVPMQFGITVNPVAQVNAVQDITACSGEPLSVGFTTQNTGGITSYEWTNNNTAIGLAVSGSGSLAFTPVNAGNTSISAVITVTPVYTNKGVSCRGNAEVFILTVEPKATVVKPQDQQVCNGLLTGNISFSGSTANTVYQWINNNNTIGLPASGTGAIAPFRAVNNGSTPVVASITVTPVINGCSGIPATFTITVNPSPRIISQPAGSVVCLGEKPAALSVAVSGIGTPAYQWYSNTVASTSGGVSVPNANGASYDPPADVAGTVYYYCEITFPNDCNGLTSAAATVTIIPNPVILAIDQEISSGESFTVSPTWDNGNIVPPGTAYVWSNPVVSPAGAVSGATAQQVPQAVISQRLVNTLAQVSTVTYTVFPVSGSCTGASFKVTVYVDAQLMPHMTIIPATCYGVNNGSIATDIQGGAPFAQGAPYVVSWAGPDGFTSTEPNIYNLAPGLYHLTVTDSRGKQIFAEATITAPEELKVIGEKKDVSCYGLADGGISITAEGGTQPYQTVWTKDAMPFALTEDITALSPGTYEVNLRDANGCTPRIMSWVIAQPDPLMVVLNGKSDIHCYGDSSGFIAVEVSGGVPGYRYRWTGPAGFTSTDKDLSHLVAGDYHLLVTDGAACTRSLAVTLTEPSPLAVSAQTTPISCYGANNATIRLNIIGGTPPYQAEWNNYATGTYQDNLSAGVYTILITDAAQCQISTTVCIAEAPVFRMNPEVKNVSCYGARDGSIALNFETTLKSVVLIWSDNVRSGTTRNNIGPGVYTVNIQGGSLCMLSRTFVVTEPAPLSLTGTVTDITDCKAASGGAIDLMVTGGTPPYRYAWSNGAVTEDLTNLQAGNYAITVTDAEGCAQVAQYTVKRPVPMVVDVSTSIAHDCASGTVKAVSTAKVSGGVAPYQLRWSTGTVSGTGNEQMETRQSGMVQLTVTDQLGCSVTRSVNIVLPEPGILSAVTDCNVHGFQFNGVPVIESEANSYRWDFGDGTGSDLKNPQHTYPSAGTYQVSLTITENGCTRVYRDVVTAETPPVVGIDKDPRFCPGDSVLIHGTGAITYLWNDGSTGDSRWISREGDYSITGISASGCQATYSFRASYYDPMGYTIQSDQEEVSQGASRIRLWSESIPYSAYHWDFGDGQSGQGAEVYHSYDISEDGYLDVNLTVINPNGCEEIATKRIWKSVTAVVNTFTPNGDGINDIYLKGWQIQVFNRNGILMYQGDEGWDGKHNGRPVDNDTYFVIIYDSTRLGAEYKKSYVTVLR